VERTRVDEFSIGRCWSMGLKYLVIKISNTAQDKIYETTCYCITCK